MPENDQPPDGSGEATEVADGVEVGAPTGLETSVGVGGAGEGGRPVEVSLGTPA